MTQAFNLSQLANRVNTSGQLNSATGLTGTVPIANGGTGVTASGASGNILTSNGTEWVSQAASAGFSGATINAPSASTLTLTSASAQCQIVQFTSPANSVITLPSATTLLYRGAPIYRLINESQCNSVVQVKNSAGTWLATIQVNEALDVTLEDNSTSAGSWMFDDVDQPPTPAAVENGSISAIVVSTAAVYQGQIYYARSPVACALTDSLYVFSWLYTDGSTGVIRQAVCAASLTGNTFAFGAINNQAPIGNPYNWINNGVSRVIRLNNTTALIEFKMWRYIDVSYSYNRVAVATVLGNTVTMGAYNATNLPESNASNAILNIAQFQGLQGYRLRITDSTFATVYHTSASNSNYAYAGGGNLNCTVTSVSGTTQTNGTEVTLAANNGNIMGVVSNTDGAFIMSYYTSSTSGAATGIRKAVTCNISGTSPTWGTVTNIDISNVTNYANFTQYGNAVSLTSTKVVLPTYQITSVGTLYNVSCFTISGATNAYVASSVANIGNESFMFFPRSSSAWLSYSQQFSDNMLVAVSTSPLTRYAVNASNVVYSDENLAFQNNLQNGGQFASNFLVPPSTSGSTVGILIGAAYINSPTSTTMNLSRGVLPT